MEKVPVVIFENNVEASHAVAKRISELIRLKISKGESAVLGLATGHTPVEVYRELIRMHREEGLDFSDVITFNLDRILADKSFRSSIVPHMDERELFRLH